MKPHVHFILALTLVENLGPKGLAYLIKIHGSPKKAFESIFLQGFGIFTDVYVFVLILSGYLFWYCEVLGAETF